MAVIQIVKKSALLSELRIDPEFYNPNFTNLLNCLRKIGGLSISSFNPIIQRGKLPVYSSDGSINVIKSAKIQNGFIDESDEFVDSSFTSLFPQAKVTFGDILINSTGRGTLGRSAILTKANGSFVIDGHISKITEIKGLSIFYLSVFLLTKYGKVQLDTSARGSSGQIEIYPQDIGDVIVPRLTQNIQKQIDDICISLYKNFEDTKFYYKEAEQELLLRMEWEQIKIEHILNYQVTSKDVLTNERIDPEFYQPKFNNITKYLQKNNSKKLGDFCSIPNRGVQPLYDKNGKILIINSKHLGPTEIDIQTVKKTTREFYDEDTTKKALLKKYDVLMYSTGAYVGRTNIYLEDALGIASNHVTIIRPDNKICNPAYLALFLNSPAGLMQTNQQASGSAQREIYPQDINKYEVFVPEKNGRPDLDWQNKLANKIIQSYEAKSKARKNLQKAKELIEDEIKKLIN